MTASPKSSFYEEFIQPEASAMQRANEVSTDAEATSHSLSVENTALGEDVLNESPSSKEMEKAENYTHAIPIGIIPESIKVLDDIISEFDDGDPSKPIVNHSENQSEDDGYMSLSRKNMDKKRSADGIQGGVDCLSLEIPNKNFEELENICLSNAIIDDINGKINKPIQQSTLPKVRSTTSTTKHYSSLPCCGERTASIDNKVRIGSCNGERNVLGIDISAVHNAVLAGGLAKLPEPILNEHPITIYPGRSSSPLESIIRKNRPHRLMTSVEKHKEVFQIINPLSSISSSSSTTSTISGGSATPSKNDTDVPTIKNVENINKNIITSTSGESICDYADGQSLSPLLVKPSVSTLSKTTPSTGIAWEIYFETKNKNLMRGAETIPMEKNVDEIIKTTITRNASNGNTVENEKREDVKNHNDCFALKKDFEYFDENPSHEISNNCMNRHKNMIGKGTFIIRKASKKPSKTAMDVFKISNFNNVSIPCQSDQKDKQSVALASDINTEHKIPNLSTKCRHSLILGISQIPSSFVVPRERLSLNIELQEQNLTVEAKETSTSPHQTNITSLKERELNIEIMDPSCLEKISNNFDNCKVIGAYNGNELHNPEYSELRTSNTTTPHTDLAPTLEEDEEQLSDFSYGCAPLKQIENNISALLRGDISVARAGTSDETATANPKRTLEFRPGVHKSESSKEMLLSQNAFGPLPPSPSSSSPELFDYNAPLPPLPPSPIDVLVVDESYKKIISAEVHTQLYEEKKHSRDNLRSGRHVSEDFPLAPLSFNNLPPAVPPHRGYSNNTMKSWSIDSKYKKHKSPKAMCYDSKTTAPTGSTICEIPGYYTKRYVSYGTKRSLKQSPREEYQHRLQTSCSLPETPIFARGCDVPRTPFRREHENSANGSRTAPRSGTSHSINMGNSIVGISGGGSIETGVFRQRSINHALASNEMLRLSGAPGRGWYPKQRSMRPASTENIDRLTSVRVWDSAAGMSGTGHTRKPQTLPPNLTPSFLNKSPREALRRVTSLLITKKKNSKDRKGKPPYSDQAVESSNIVYGIEKNSCAQDSIRSSKHLTQKPSKKKGLFKNIWKKTKHFSLDQ